MLLLDGTHQDQRGIVKSVPRIDIGTLRNRLLAHLEIASPTCFAQLFEACAELEAEIDKKQKEEALYGVTLSSFRYGMACNVEQYGRW